MKLNDEIKNIYGIVEVEVEGFFTERYINLCRINNVSVWDIVTKSNGIIIFKMFAKDFKKLRAINRKTKCKSKILKKKGVYFNYFRYRKRRFFIIFVLIFLVINIILIIFIFKFKDNGSFGLISNSVLS